MRTLWKRVSNATPSTSRCAILAPTSAARRLSIHDMAKDWALCNALLDPIPCLCSRTASTGFFFTASFSCVAWLTESAGEWCTWACARLPPLCPSTWPTSSTCSAIFASCVLQPTCAISCSWEEACVAGSCPPLCVRRRKSNAWQLPAFVTAHYARYVPASLLISQCGCYVARYFWGSEPRVAALAPEIANCDTVVIKGVCESLANTCPTCRVQMLSTLHNLETAKVSLRKYFS